MTRWKQRLVALMIMTPVIVLSGEKTINYGGISPHITLEDLQKKFPNSTIETGKEFNSITVRVSGTDVVSHINYIRIVEYGGKRHININLVNEKKLEKGPGRTWEQARERAAPSCISVLDPLVKEHGKPMQKDRFIESIHENSYIWEFGVGTLEFACWALSGKGKEFANQIIITKSLNQ
jgi:hypothetical protein